MCWSSAGEIQRWIAAGLPYDWVPKNVKVMLRTPISAMLASPWEIEDTLAEGIPILENHNPAEYVVEDGKLTGMKFEIIEYDVAEDGAETFTPTGKTEPHDADWCSC